MENLRRTWLAGPLGALPPQQREILMTLKLSGELTAVALAEALYSSPTNIRHGLRVLRMHGLVESGPRAAAVPGRPPRVFYLTESAQRLFPSMAPDVLRAVVETADPDLQARLSAAVERVVEAKIGLQQAAGVPALILTLERLGYLPDPIPVPGGVRIELGHCPWWEVGDLLPGVCEAHSGALARLSGVRVSTRPRRPTDPTCVLLCHAPDGGA